jgi:hypothetical protein
MTAVRIRAYDEAGKVTDLSDIGPSTDVMAITSLPMAPSQSSGCRSPLERLLPATCHPGLPPAPESCLTYPPTANRKPQTAYFGATITCPCALR